MGGRGSVIVYVCYSRVKVYSRQYTIGYVANICNEHRNRHCDDVNIFILRVLFTLNSFLSAKPSQSFSTSKNSQLYLARFCQFCPKSFISGSVIFRVYCTITIILESAIDNEPCNVQLPVNLPINPVIIPVSLLAQQCSHVSILSCIHISVFVFPSPFLLPASVGMDFVLLTSILLCDLVVIQK